MEHRKLKILTLAAIYLLISGADSTAQTSQVNVYEEDWTIPGYRFPEADVNPMFFKGEAYQGASKVIYPYQLLDNVVRENQEKTLKTIILENEYIKVCITPEIGGKMQLITALALLMRQWEIKRKAVNTISW